MSQTRPLSLITGASAGIGAAFAHALAARGHDLVLTARRVDRLDELAAQLRERHGCQATVIAADLADPSAPAELANTLEAMGLDVDWLINNAGYGVPGSLAASPWERHATFIQVMMTAPTELAWRVLPGMRRRGYGRIINVASLAAFMPGTAGHTLYGASKAYLVKFSQCLALENIAKGVHVCALCPGFTWSEFHDVTGTREKMNKLPKYMWQTAEAVVEEGIAAVERGDAMHVSGRFNRLLKAVVKLLPDRLALKLSAKESHRYRDAVE